MSDLFQQAGRAQVAAFLDRHRQPLAAVADALTAPANLLFHPILVLPLVVVAIDGSATAAASLATISVLAWLIPQLLVGQSAFRNWLLVARAVVALIAGIGVAVVGSGSGLLSGLIVGMGVYWALGGLLAGGSTNGVLPWSDEGTWVDSMARLLGGSLAVLAGLFIARLVGSDGPGFPGWLLQLALVATLALAAAAGLSWRERLAAPRQSPPWRDIALIPALLAHGRRPRRYMVFRALLLLAALADPVLILSGLRSFGLTMQGAGVALAVCALIHLVAVMSFPSLVAAGYARILAQSIALTRVVVPVAMLSLPLIVQATPFTSAASGDTAWLLPAAFLAIAALFGLALSGTQATDAAYLHEAMAPGHRNAMQALLVIMLAIGSLAYLVGGQVVDRWGMSAVWLVAASVGLVALLASGLLLDVPPADTRDLMDTGALPTYREQHDWS